MLDRKYTQVVCISHIISWHASDQYSNPKPLQAVLFDDPVSIAWRIKLINYGSKVMESPNNDKLASQSVVFKRIYCQIVVHSLSHDQASLLTGT